MARKEVEVGTGLEFIRPSKLAENGITGVILTGTYIGPVNNDLTGRNDYKFENTEGKTVIINGAGSLDVRMSEVQPGTLVEVEYHGKEEITSGRLKGKSAHQFKVFLEDNAG